MPLSAHLLLAATALCCFATLFAFPSDAHFSGCRCLTTTADRIPKNLWRRIEIFPPGAHCRNTEILLTLKSSQKVCVDPNTKWTKEILESIVKTRR